MVGALAASVLFAAPMARADEKADSATQKALNKKAWHDAEVMRKYDKNGNGVLDADELALKQANEDKMKALRDKRKQKTAERKAKDAAASVEASTTATPAATPETAAKASQ